MTMIAERHYAAYLRKQADKDRRKYVPTAIANTLRKLEHLTAEAERRNIPFDDEWRERIDNLHSRYLVNQSMVDAEWDKMIQEARGE